MQTDDGGGYPGAKITNVLPSTADGKAGGMTRFQSADPPGQIIAFYKARAAAAGLGKVSSMQTQGTEMFGATNAAGDRQLSVNVTVGDGRTTGPVSYSVPGQGGCRAVRPLGIPAPHRHIAGYANLRALSCAAVAGRLQR